MKKHLLITVNEEQPTLNKLRYLHAFFAEPCDLGLTLFHVKRENSSASKGEKAIEKAQEWLSAEGCPKELVTVKIKESKANVIEEIVREAHKGMYDAVVLGRRSFSWFEELVEQSVSKEILWGEIDFPVWVCRMPEIRSCRNVLLSVDGSPPSIRMADHVGFILGDKEKHKVTAIYVDSDEDHGETDEIFARTLEALKANGVPEDMITTKIVKARKPADAILKEAISERYAVVAMGKTGGSPSGMDKLFPGSVSTKLLRNVEDFSLWICK